MLYHHRRKFRTLYVFALTLLAAVFVLSDGLCQTSPPLSPGATVSAFGRTSLVREDGSFDIFGVLAGVGPFIVVYTAQDGTTATSSYLTPVADGITNVPFLSSAALYPPISLTLSAPTYLLASVGQTVQMTVQAKYATGLLQDHTDYPLTYYVSSNPSIATVSQTGVVTVKSVPPGTSMLIITVTVDGTTGAIPFQVMSQPPPSVAILSPAEGATFVVNQPVFAQATASGPLSISRVDFTVDGAVAITLNSLPYNGAFTPPPGDHTIGVHAYDSTGQRGDAVPVHIHVIPDPLTTITGRIVDSGHNPIAGALVSTAGFSVSTGSDGHFILYGIPTAQTSLTVTASAPAPLGKSLTGSSPPLTLIRGGITDAGDIVLSEKILWSRFHADARNSGQGSGSGAAGALKWKNPLNAFNQSSLDSSPAIGADGTLYVGYADWRLYALNSATGAVKWSYRTTFPVHSSPAIGSDGTIYFGSDDKSIYALNGQTGALKWKYVTSVSFYVRTSPVIGSDGTVYVSADYLYALDGQTGVLKWKYPSAGTSSSSPAIGSDGTVYFGSDDGYLHAIDGQTGVRKWIYSVGLNFSNHPSPVLGSDDTVYISSVDDFNAYPVTSTLYAVDGHTGGLKWKYQAGTYIRSSPAISKEGTIYLCGNNGSLMAIDSATGLPKWQSFPGATDALTDIAIGSDKTVYAGSDSGYLYAVDGQTGLTKWSYLPGTLNFTLHSPALGADGTIYVGSSDGFLYAIN